MTKNRYGSLFLVLALSLVSMAFLMELKNGTRWYNTFLCFWLGMMYGQFRPLYESIVQKNLNRYVISGCVLSVLFLIAIVLRERLIFYIIHALLFTLLVNHLSMSVVLDSPTLKWLGAHIFSIYILQRIPMIIGDRLGWSDSHVLIYFGFSIITTMILAEVFDGILGLISKKIFVPIKMKMNEG